MSDEYYYMDISSNQGIGDTNEYMKEYDANKQKMAQINNYYNLKYKAQKDIVKYISFTLMLIIVIILLGKFILPDEITQFVLIVVSVVASVRIGLKIFDSLMRSPVNYDEYNFGKLDHDFESVPAPVTDFSTTIGNSSNTKYNFSNWKANMTKDTLFDESQIASSANNCGNRIPQIISETDVPNILLDGKCYQLAEEAGDAIQMWNYIKDCRDSYQCSYYLNDIWSKSYDVTSNDWDDSIQQIHSLNDDIAASSSYASGESAYKYCNRVCSIDDASSQVLCFALCKGGGVGLQAQALDDYALRLRADDGGLCTDNSTFIDSDDVLLNQSWYNTEISGSSIYDDDNDDGTASLTEWGTMSVKNTEGRQGDLYEYCNYKCYNMDMSNCFNGNINSDHENACKKRCERVIPKHYIPAVGVDGTDISYSYSDFDDDNPDFWAATSHLLGDDDTSVGNKATQAIGDGAPRVAGFSASAFKANVISPDLNENVTWAQYSENSKDKPLY
tara:strand:+ start:3470 stop:4975 length:1506 start_codon:yes stop_codon:yes gene_type:complete